MNENNNVPTQAEDTIDLIVLVKMLWEGRKRIIKITIFFMLFGLFVALFSQKEYTASTTMVPQSSGGGPKLSGSLGGLAAMAGFNIGGVVDGDIPPTLYPEIVNSIPFQKELVKTNLSIEGLAEQITFAHYYEEVYSPGVFGYVKKYTLGLPGVIIKAIRGERQSNSLLQNNENLKIISITEGDKELIERLESQLNIDINDNDGYVTISMRMPEPVAAAQMVKKAQILLQDAITDFKIQKAKDQLTFVEERYEEKEKEAKAAQNKLAQFRDRNKNVSTATAQTEQERLIAEYNLVYGVYSELAKQLETQKIRVKQNTPVFTILEPVSIPIEKSKPQRPLILIIWTFLGGIVGVGTIFGKEFLQSFKVK
ncbi:Wzz/FepE/Etk N-terminal domain-containing protein [Marinifilum fragile]|uniref:Wzz/FepE/Etk N-terminal domain-containing protein n=1 Tax=Marinifilum fragile TaxID=570161 RepID=UPI002AA80464|nr:Wzz/FepE/Etk N-terminal domain-containing protein [Marinifilum fragile]